MSHDLYAAMCLVLVIEGLVLCVMPRGWQNMMREASEMDPRTLRLIGVGAMVLGAVILGLVY